MLGFISSKSGKKSSLGLLLAVAKQELKRTEGMLAQLQEIRALQGQLDRHVQTEQRNGPTDQHSTQGEAAADHAIHEAHLQDVSVALDDLRKKESTYKQELQAFLREYKKRGTIET
eukprot:jgi/Ulvmu1/7800/UM004_0029.1